MPRRRQQGGVGCCLLGLRRKVQVVVRPSGFGIEVDPGNTFLSIFHSKHNCFSSLGKEYARVHFGTELEERIANGIWALEKNWVGPVVGNPQIKETFAIFDSVARDMSPRTRWKWRLQQLMYRSHYDLFIQERASILKQGKSHNPNQIIT